MSSWITNGLKTLRIRVSGAVGSVSQQRSPPYFGADAAASAKEVQIPPKPKRPLTAYMRYAGQVRAQVVKENPSLKPTELMKLVAQRWTNLDEPTKQSYMAAFKNEMLSFSKVMEKYKSSLTPEQIQAQLQLKHEKQVMKEKRERRKRLRELGKPKKPTSAYFSFISSKVPAGSGIAEYQNAAKQLTESWKTMSDAQKAPYLDKYKKDLENYEKALTSWEIKMMKQGHDDLVRESHKRAVSNKAK